MVSGELAKLPPKDQKKWHVCVAPELPTLGQLKLFGGWRDLKKTDLKLINTVISGPLMMILHVVLVLRNNASHQFSVFRMADEKSLNFVSEQYGSLFEKCVNSVKQFGDNLLDVLRLRTNVAFNHSRIFGGEHEVSVPTMNLLNSFSANVLNDIILMFMYRRIRNELTEKTLQDWKKNAVERRVRFAPTHESVVL